MVDVPHLREQVLRGLDSQISCTHLVHAFLGVQYHAMDITSVCHRPPEEGTLHGPLRVLCAIVVSRVREMKAAEEEKRGKEGKKEKKSGKARVRAREIVDHSAIGLGLASVPDPHLIIRYRAHWGP